VSIVSQGQTTCLSEDTTWVPDLQENKIPLVVAGSFGNIFARNCINNAMMTLTLPRLVERLRVCFPAPSSSTGLTRHQLTRRTGWTLTWDIQRSVVVVQEGEQGESWVEEVGDLPANVQAIIAAGGLESWCRAEIAKYAQSSLRPESGIRWRDYS